MGSLSIVTAVLLNGREKNSVIREWIGRADAYSHREILDGILQMFALKNIFSGGKRAFERRPHEC